MQLHTSGINPAVLCKGMSSRLLCVTPDARVLNAQVLIMLAGLEEREGREGLGRAGGIKPIYILSATLQTHLISPHKTGSLERQLAFSMQLNSLPSSCLLETFVGVLHPQGDDGNDIIIPTINWDSALAV